jgi:hypothetical protein
VCSDAYLHGVKLGLVVTRFGVKFGLVVTRFGVKFGFEAENTVSGVFICIPDLLLPRGDIQT